MTWQWKTAVCAMVHPLGELEVTHSASEMSSNRLMQSSIFKILNACSLRAFFPTSPALSLFYRSPQKQQEDLSFPYRHQQSTAVQSQQVFPPHRQQTSAPAVVEGSGITRCTWRNANLSKKGHPPMTDLLETPTQRAGSLHTQVTGSQKRSFLISMFKSSAVTVTDSQPFGLLKNASLRWKSSWNADTYVLSCWGTTGTAEQRR